MTLNALMVFIQILAYCANHYLVRITKADKGFIKRRVKIRDIHKIRHLQDK